MKNPIDEMTPEQRKRFERALKKWERRTVPLIEKIRESERITEKDLSIIVGPCDDI